MPVVITHSPRPDEAGAYERILHKILPTRPLYFFLAVSALLMALMIARHLRGPSSQSLIFILIAALCLLLGGAMLYATYKSLPPARARLLASLGHARTYTFTEDTLTIEGDPEGPLTYARSKLAGQYCTDRHYIFCFAEGARMAPVVIGVDEENLSALNEIVQGNVLRGVKLKRIRIRA